MKRIILVITIITFSITTFSQTIDIEKAELISLSWASSHNLQSEVENIICKTVGNDTLLYIFCFKGAWIMVSAGKSLLPILGFSFDSKYPETNEPYALYSLFEFYDSVKNKNRDNGVEYTAEWELVESESFIPMKSTQEVEPLIPVNWGQDWPYNAYCPEDTEMGANFNGHHNTSCGPTAFAQILRYWSYPVHGSGYNSYTYNDLGFVEANFGATYYNWSNMPASLGFNDPESSYTDIATLMLHAAVSVDGAWGGGSGLHNYASAAIKYFNYSPKTEVYFRDDFTSYQWHGIVRNELDNHRPILISGVSSSGGGHYFVCDGYYGDDFYHVNWGWKGSGNGYFPLYQLGSFTMRNYAIIGLEPNYQNEEIKLNDPYTTDNNTVVLLHFDGDLTNQSSLTDDPTEHGTTAFADNSELGLGECLYLNNSSQENQSYLDIVDNNDLDLSSDWTIEMWFKPTSLGGKYTLLNKPGENDNFESNYNIYILPSWDYYFPYGLYCSFHPTGEPDYYRSWINTERNFIELGKWYHISYIRNSSNHTHKMIIHDSNRKLLHYSSRPYIADAASQPLINSNPLLIGSGNQSNTFFDGYIDELRVSNVAREFEITSTSLTLIAPNGGEVWESGSLEAIRWNSENIDNLRIEYSINNGDTWLLISESYGASQGSYFWEVPDVVSDKCLIKITDVTKENIFQKSNLTFTIERKTNKIWQEINLYTGWNILSLNVEPENADLLSIVQPLIDNETLHKIIDEGGNITQHMPWGWVNNIGNLSNTEGYYAKVTSNVTLSVYGSVVPCPFDIDLFTGWNIMGYPCQNPQDAMEALQVLIDEGKLDKVIDENGNILQHMPWGWVNNIGNLSPGEGYYIKLSENTSITFEEPGLSASSEGNKHSLLHKEQDNGDLKKMK